MLGTMLSGENTKTIKSSLCPQKALGSCESVWHSVLFQLVFDFGIALGYVNEKWGDQKSDHIYRGGNLK